MKKICLLTVDMRRKGGLERMAAFLANGLSSIYNIFIFNLLGNPGETFYQLSPDIQCEYCSSLNGKDERISEIKKIILLHSFLKKEKIDILINVDTGTAITGIPAAWFTKTKVITWEHSNFYNNWNDWKFPYIRKFAAKFSDMVVVLTERDKKNYLNNIQKCAPIKVIYNPMPDVKADYNIKSKTILSAVNLLSNKQVDKMIKIATSVLPKHNEWKMRICGEGPERIKLEQMIKDNQMQDYIELPGIVKNMDFEYRNAALFVLTSKYEGLPMVLLEAKAYKIPSVSFDIVTGPSEIIDDEVNGYIIRQDDERTFAEKLEELICDEKKRLDFSCNSLTNIDRFKSSSILVQWNQLCELLLQKT